jgi:hypothetical protein
LSYLANFTEWAQKLLQAWQKFWANLFAQKRGRKTEEEEESVESAPVERLVPFRDFTNPFASGAADQMTLRDLVRYTFAALEAWAREHDLGRKKDETAQEFIYRVSEEIPALETEGKRLANLHARAEYARERLPASTAEAIRSFWHQLERVVEAPLSA